MGRCTEKDNRRDSPTKGYRCYLSTNHVSRGKPHKFRTGNRLQSDWVTLKRSVKPKPKAAPNRVYHPRTITESLFSRAGHRVTMLNNNARMQSGTDKQPTRKRGSKDKS